MLFSFVCSDDLYGLLPLRGPGVLRRENSFSSDFSSELPVTLSDLALSGCLEQCSRKAFFLTPKWSPNIFPKKKKAKVSSCQGLVLRISCRVPYPLTYFSFGPVGHGSNLGFFG